MNQAYLSNVSLKMLSKATHSHKELSIKEQVWGQLFPPVCLDLTNVLIHIHREWSL
jgi:hypothetical protein